MNKKPDSFDRAILRTLQKDAGLSQRDLAARVGLSQNACWRRLNALRAAGLAGTHTLRLDPAKLGLGLTVFVMIRTRSHSHEWLERFHKAVNDIPNVIDFYRIAGDYDYMLKILTQDMETFDRIYRTLISRVDLDTVTSCIAMETIAANRDLPI
ncbi:Lrp/AsnC family transcriptional regulator [Komagataeibacter rhaeticus]|uniref:Lrp/AsnC family transcriptional regulator n=1 Tax=Komagataeibacter rhaeticus TaxID=215221 RepID=A0A181CD77_9PROT|nr:Lrp/AsnC family transcriptional regulator [Komagataeibacter rhaeticus]ATU71735.1 Lrp/AsnC family transcriptional regulator [Komagataeibacter xylinus]EGG77454.1 Glutamate uptake regulatory protein [Gluconacetobacter sp. SXCC-1]KDU97497.1 transcriptional regulator [Komagataeibacter rhaeticus AF1]MBL7239190.1 Lrp/AsnC family transcriptional regulator [Komagataeibacter rhaeticus]PYD53798.1 Lrp/AsnC family transcriptional regulator [Komagataeibacter rhaeticus]